MLARVRSVRTRLLAEYPAQTVVVVSHVTPIKLILQDALAAGDAFLHRLFLDPAGVSLVDSGADGGVAVRTVNDTPTWPAWPDLPSIVDDSACIRVFARDAVF